MKEGKLGGPNGRLAGLLLLLGFLLIYVAGVAPAAERLFCDGCGSEIHGRYVQISELEILCAACFEDRRPACANCGNPCPDQYVRSQDGAKCFCSEACARNALLPHCDYCGEAMESYTQMRRFGQDVRICPRCAQLPRCFACELPDAQCVQLPDGRWECRNCCRLAVKRSEDCQAIFRQLRSYLAEQMSFDAQHAITLQVVAADAAETTANYTKREFGKFLYRAVETVTTTTEGRGKKAHTEVARELSDEQCVILVLSDLPRERLEEVLVHELAHDAMQHRYGALQDLKLQEGFAELVASVYNQAHNRAYLNADKQDNPDTVYGDGYRMMRNLFNTGSWPAVFRRLETANAAALEAQRKADKAANPAMR